MNAGSLDSLFSPKLLLPLTLLTPYVFVLQYGISLLELMVFASLVFILLPSIFRQEVKLPKFFLVFFTLYTLGYLGALLNGVRWHVPIGIWNLNFFYKAILAFGAFYIGVRYRGEICDIFKSRLFLMAILVLGAIAIVYPFLPYETKIQYFGIFYQPDSGFERYYRSRRLPGMGINANIYSFMMFSYLLLSFRFFLDRKMSFVFPLVCFLVIFVLSSKTVLGLSVLGCIALLLHRTVRVSVSDIKRSIGIAFRKRSFHVLIAIVVLTGSVVLGAVTTTTGRAIMDSYATIDRFQVALTSSRSADGDLIGIPLRLSLWGRGLERVELAPLLGIARDPFRSLEGTVVGFYNPHNEFLRMWILYGFLGLCAWIYLLSYLSYRNLSSNTGKEWFLLYGALAGFMIVDGGLDDPRVVVYLFLMIGLNWKQIKEQVRSERLFRPSPGGAPAVASR